MAALRDDSPVQYIRGIGPARARWFDEAGLRTVGDLLYYFPFRHEVDSGEIEIADLRPGMKATIRGEVSQVRGRRGPSFTAKIYDGTETCVLRWFRQPFSARQLYPGALVIASGSVQHYNDRLEMVQPRVQVYPPDAVVFPQNRGTRRVGIYRGAGRLKSEQIRRAVQVVLEQPHLPVEEFLPEDLLRKYDLPDRPSAVRQMHVPKDDAELQRARQRLAYEEFLLLELAMAIRRRKTIMLQKGQKLHVTPEVDKRIRARFPFKLTASQNEVIREITDDLESGRPMTRLLQGDVGCGKTVVALYACLAAIANGRQAALMAPTEILAQQHFGNIERYLQASRVRYVLLRGKLAARERAEILASIENGAIDLVIGTHALIQKDVVFARLALVVVDEQHKFGVMQRATFRTKGPLPHYLVMTATPIPRTLSMTVFGDLDVSIIRHSPPGRGRVTTKVVTTAQWKTVMNYVRQQLEQGSQAYVVCPQIGPADDSTPPVGSGADASPDITGKKQAAISARQVYQRLTKGPWRDLNVGLLYGSMNSAEKDRVIAAFAAGELHALVATTVVEVGVDVPNATIMVVENAERFGRSQLHQLRGRVGRGHQDSICVLIARGAGRRAASESNKAAQRLAVMTETTDGFRIAEADLRQRGPGELFGTRQHGLPELRVGNLIDDFDLLERARADAFEIIRQDPSLEHPEHQALIPALKRMFGGKLALIDAA
ncbi:MAG: ATP-dependent DNA helicase RecG [Planctomycetota bacterium]